MIEDENKNSSSFVTSKENFLKFPYFDTFLALYMHFMSFRLKITHL